MKKQIIVLVAISTLFSGCCTKKGCPDWELPGLTIHFTGIEIGDEITLYTLKNDVVIDSSEQIASIDLDIRPFSEYNVESAAGSSFIISHNGKKESISNFTAEFMQEEIVCNRCFPFGKDKETVWKYQGFAYQHNNQVKNELTLTVDF